MAFDLQIISPQQAIPITQIIPITDGDGRQVLLIGDDFSAVDEVTINDAPSPGYLVVSQNRMIAELPEGITPGQITSVAVLSKQLVLTPKSLLRFRIGKVPSKVNGILRLVQLFIRILLATPGSDIFNPLLGGGVLQSLGKNFSKEEAGNIVRDFVIAVDSVKRQILALQGRQGNLPPGEKLLDAKVEKATYDPNETALLVTILLTSQSGKTGYANLVL